MALDSHQQKSRIQSWLLLGLIVAVTVVVANFAISNPDVATNGVDAFLGMPKWAFPSIAGAGGVLVYLFGLRVATNWPEALGAALISGALISGMVMFGWENFQLGGIAAVPFILPVVLFIVLMLVALSKSK